MAFFEKLKEIETYLEKIEQLNKSITDRGELGRLQGDLVKEYLRDMYELYADLEKMDAAAARNVTPIPVEPELTQEIQPEPPQEVAEERIPEKVIEPPIVKQTPEPAMTEARSEQGAPAAQKLDEETETPISLLEKFQQESSATNVNRKKVSGKILSELIPLNEKFIFIADFFDNSISKYEATIAELDQLTTKTEVLDFMQQNVWSSEIIESQQDLIDRFIRIIDRKYSD